MKDSTEFELFFKTYYFRLYSYAMHIVHDDEEAKDIVYDCFEYMWNHYDDRDVKIGRRMLILLFGINALIRLDIRMFRANT